MNLAASSVAMRLDPEAQRRLLEQVRQSGDVNVLAGALRGHEHTIDRDELFSPIRDKANRPVRGRVSITIRQAGP